MAGDLKRGRAGVERDAVAVLDQARSLSSDKRLLWPMEASPNFESELSPAASDAYGTAMGPEYAPFLLEHSEVLSNRHLRNGQALAQVDDGGSRLLLDHTSD